MSKSAPRIDPDAWEKWAVAPKVNGVYMNSGFTTPVHAFKRKFKDFNPDDYLFFSTVRNPFDHLVSIYHYGWSQGRRGINMAANFTTFEDFIKAFCDKDPRINAPYFNRFLYFQWFDDDGNNMVKYALRTEKLTQGAELLCSQFGIKTQEVPWTEKKEEGGLNISRKRDYREYYNNQTRELVEKKCERELRAFGYDFDGCDDRALLDVGDIKYNPYTDTGKTVSIGLRGANRTRSVCEVLRLINDKAQGDTERDKEIRNLVAEATDYTKRMAKKLWEYHHEYGVERYDKDWYEKNKYLTKKDQQLEAQRRSDPTYKIGEFE